MNLNRNHFSFLVQVIDRVHLNTTSGYAEGRDLDSLEILDGSNPASKGFNPASKGSNLDSKGFFRLTLAVCRNAVPHRDRKTSPAHAAHQPVAGIAAGEALSVDAAVLRGALLLAVLRRGEQWAGLH